MWKATTTSEQRNHKVAVDFRLQREWGRESEGESADLLASAWGGSNHDLVLLFRALLAFYDLFDLAKWIAPFQFLNYDTMATCWAVNCDWNVICQNKFNGLSSRRRNAPEGQLKPHPDRIGSGRVAADISEFECDLLVGQCATMACVFNTCANLIKTTDQVPPPAQQPSSSPSH